MTGLPDELYVEQGEELGESDDSRFLRACCLVVPFARAGTGMKGVEQLDYTNLKFGKGALGWRYKFGCHQIEIVMSAL